MTSIPGPGPGSGTDILASGPTWWRHGVFYQVYIKSFADGNGDGIGDIAGLRSRLPYLSRLGVDALWINPWYRSPLRDGGYDVADYRDIDPRLGTLAAAEQLVRDAHDIGIRVITDLVPNHTSSDHVWFKEALAADPGAAARARYHFLPGKGANGTEPPNNWQSLFGGPAWERVADGEWYLHLFDAAQPDLNWTNQDVRAEFDRILRFWLDRGFDGFRVDVAHCLTKDPDYPDVAGDPTVVSWYPNHPYWDRDETHEIIRGWRKVLDEYDGRMMVAEATVDADRIPRFVRRGEYHQAFNFPFLEAGWEATAMRRLIPESITASKGLGSIPTWVLSNHDVVRHTTRFGLPRGVESKAWLVSGPHGQLDQELGLRRARAAALLMLALPGSAYLYQGEELGLPEVWDLPDSALDDPIWQRSHGRRRGRDGCRVPIPWTADGPSLGFGNGEAWLPQPPQFVTMAADQQIDRPGSTYELYREALRLRRHYGVGDEDLEMIDAGPEVISFKRGSGLICVVNMDTEPAPLPSGEILISSSDVSRGELDPDDTVWLLES